MKTATHLRKKFLRRSTGVLSCLGLSCLIGSGCGILGNKDDASRTLAQDNGACLDNMGPLVNDFIDGTVDQNQWVSTWNCVDDTIDLFKTYVQGSDAASYTPTDLQSLTQRFLFSRHTVTLNFIKSLLSVKASLLGGTDQNLTKAELESYRGLVRFLRDETTKLIPLIKNRKNNPNSTNLRAFADGLEAFGNHVADYLNTGKNPTLSLDQGVTFMRELAALGLEMSADRIESWTRFVNEIKVLLVQGEPSGMAGADWSQILRMGCKLGGSAVAFSDALGEDPLFQSEMVDRVHTVLKSSMALWGNLIPYTQLNKVVDTMPREILPTLAEDFRAAVKTIMRPRAKTTGGKTQFFRPALSTAFASKSDAGIDLGAIQRIVDAFHTGARANDLLMKIYSGLKEDLYPDEFETQARAYAASAGLTGSADIERLVTLAHRYPGLHAQDSPEILFNGQEKHSLNNLKRMNWYELGAGLLLGSYGSTSDTYGKAAVLGDLTLLIDDLNPVLIATGMSHPLKTGIDKKRFREANLFIPTGNGDDKMNLPETAVYIAFIFSGTRQATRITDLAMEGATPCPTLGWDVPLKQQVYDIHCFRTRWTNTIKDQFVNMPKLLDEYHSMSQSDRDLFYYNLEYASKTTGYNDDPMTEFDVSSYAGLPHFAESIMQKYDRNGDGSLDRDETLDYVFPTFKNELASLSGIKIDFVNKAVILYLMQYGKQPSIGDLLGWALGFEFLRKFNARRLRVYQIFSALSPPAPKDPISQTPPPGVDTGNATFNFLANSLIKGLTPAPDLTLAATPTVQPSTTPPPATKFDITKVDPAQFQGYTGGGPIIDPTSPYQEALDVLPQDL